MHAKRGIPLAVTAALSAALLTPALTHAAEAVPRDDAPASATSAPSVTKVDVENGWTAKAAADYWTPKRMAAATSETSKGATPEGAAELKGNKAAYFRGTSTVGTFFYVKNGKKRFCSGSVINSPRKDVVLTAAHCTFGSTRSAFVPKYNGAAKNKAPYGTFAVNSWFRAKYDPKNKRTSSYDYAFARLATNRKGQRVQQATKAALTLTAAKGFKHKVTVMGYPNAKHNKNGRPIFCRTTTKRLAPYKQMRMSCAGFYGGTSGSPWVVGYNKRTGTGRVIGSLGGLDKGGPNHRISYAPAFGKFAFKLFAAAKK
ncbi:trypsin-like serine protease [Streptomyces sp. MZ04]|uniref:trypsin-like serine peptidase n=1 Tax=Streptomyces sp. MZ04 TaxID=2559236 RepID=UPI00107EC581|nr:trypsin-like serine protease [Streptomyces sp. MZ04]TGB08369.1 serine protease [Streptomyces sp. MZ04]